MYAGPHNCKYLRVIMMLQLGFHKFIAYTLRSEDDGNYEKCKPQPFLLGFVLSTATTPKRNYPRHNHQSQLQTASLQSMTTAVPLSQVKSSRMLAATNALCFC
jgi:hypothetical protein